MTNEELISKIKAEIDKLYGEYKNKFHQCGDQYHLGLIDGLDMAERVLDSLESEKPMQGLEEEIVKVCDDFAFPLYGLDDEFGRELINKIARHFAQWGAEHAREQMMKEDEKPCHTVEEWMEHIKNADGLTKAIFSKGPYDVLYDALNRPYRDCYDAIKEFGELCYQTARQDMMKEAVAVQVVGEQRDLRLIDSTQRCLFNANRGDWLKIIIVKEDEK